MGDKSKGNIIGAEELINGYLLKRWQLWAEGSADSFGPILEMACALRRQAGEEPCDHIDAYDVTLLGRVGVYSLWSIDSLNITVFNVSKTPVTGCDSYSSFDAVLTGSSAIFDVGSGCAPNEDFCGDIIRYVRPLPKNFLLLTGAVYHGNDMSQNPCDQALCIGYSETDGMTYGDQWALVQSATQIDKTVFVQSGLEFQATGSDSSAMPFARIHKAVSNVGR